MCRSTEARVENDYELGPVVLVSGGLVGTFMENIVFNSSPALPH